MWCKAMVHTKNDTLFGRVAQAHDVITEYECSWLQRPNIWPSLLDTTDAASSKYEGTIQRVLASTINNLGLCVWLARGPHSCSPRSS